jgi:hypothetical protein
MRGSRGGSARSLEAAAAAEHHVARTGVGRAAVGVMRADQEIVDAVRALLGKEVANGASAEQLIEAVTLADVAGVAAAAMAAPAIAAAVGPKSGLGAAEIFLGL